MGNFFVAITLQRELFKAHWRWIPQFRKTSGNVAEPYPYKVKYLDFQWLCFQLSWNNER